MLPFLLGATATIGLGTKFVTERIKYGKAEQIMEAAKEKYKCASNAFDEELKEADEFITDYIEVLIKINQTTLQQFYDFLNKRNPTLSHKSIRNIKRIANQGFKFNISINSSQTSSKNTQNHSTSSLVGATTVGGATAALIGGSAIGLAKTFGVSSTGTPISQLSGAASKNALLAFFGGGSKASGGGGIDVGTVVLGGIILIPMALVGNYILSSKGNDKIAQAEVYASNVDEAIHQIEQVQDFLHSFCERLTRLSELVSYWNGELKKILKELELTSLPTSKEKLYLRRALVLVKAIEKIQTTPILDERGLFNKRNDQLLTGNLLRDIEKKIEEKEKALENLQKILKSATFLSIIALCGWLGWMRLEHEIGWDKATALATEATKIDPIAEPEQLTESQIKIDRAIDALNSTQELPGCKPLQKIVVFPSQFNDFLGCRSLKAKTIQENLLVVKKEAKFTIDFHNAQKLAMEAALLVQNPPHPLETWNQSLAKWKEAIEILESIPENLSISVEARKKLESYYANRMAIQNRIVLEEKALILLRLANDRGNNLKECQEAINSLQQIPTGTFVSLTAKRQLSILKAECLKFTVPLQKPSITSQNLTPQEVTQITTTPQSTY